LVKGDNGEPAVVPGSGADKAGLRERDIILEVDGKKITSKNSLAKMIQIHEPGDKITLKVLRGKKTLKIEATLGEKTS
jgi:serine protease Do